MLMNTISILRKKYLITLISSVLTVFLGLAAVKLCTSITLFENLRATMPEWQALAHSLSKGAVTSKMAETYVRGRLDMRIAYWKKELKDWKARWGKEIGRDKITGKAYKELCEIPFYIVSNPNVTSYDLVDNIFVCSDKKAQEHYASARPDGNDIVWQRAGGFFEISKGVKTIYLQDLVEDGGNDRIFELFPYGFLATIEHELTHTEQYLSGCCKAKMLGKTPKEYPFLTNADSHASIQENQELVSSSDQGQETEADMQAIKFHPNVYGLHQLYCKHRDLGCAEKEKEYLSRDASIQLTQKYLKGRPEDKNTCIYVTR